MLFGAPTSWSLVRTGSAVAAEGHHTVLAALQLKVAASYPFGCTAQVAGTDMEAVHPDDWAGTCWCCCTLVGPVLEQLEGTGLVVLQPHREPVLLHVHELYELELALPVLAACSMPQLAAAVVCLVQVNGLQNSI